MDKATVRFKSNGSGYENSARGQFVNWFQKLGSILASDEYRIAIEPASLESLMRNNGIGDLWDTFFDLTENVDCKKDECDLNRIFNRSRRCSGLLQIIAKTVNQKASGLSRSLIMELRSRSLSLEGVDMLHNVIGTPTSRALSLKVNDNAEQSIRIQRTLQLLLERGNRKL